MVRTDVSREPMAPLASTSSSVSTAGVHVLKFCPCGIIRKPGMWLNSLFHPCV